MDKGTLNEVQGEVIQDKNDNNKYKLTFKNVSRNDSNSPYSNNSINIKHDNNVSNCYSSLSSEQLNLLYSENEYDLKSHKSIITDKSDITNLSELNINKSIKGSDK